MKTVAISIGTLVLALLPLGTAHAQPAQPADIARQEQHARAVTIVRDEWGIAHVTGKTDADAVFGAVYAQAEDDFNRIETNYLVALGRLAEAEGEAAIWQDLRARLFTGPEQLQADYAASPDWLRRLMTAWADGLNHYLRTHPEIRPRVLTRFEPWMALSFTEGSIGGDIERIDLAALESFYGERKITARVNPDRFVEPAGSNGFAVAPSRTERGHALLLINPHTSFFFRSELQMTSGEGLNAYGAVTWGQFFVYQGFNERAGWMHTSSGVDNVDEFAETIAEEGGKLRYRFGRDQRDVTASPITLAYRSADGGKAERRFTGLRTHHGPIVRAEDGKWIAFAAMHKPVAALQQSWLRTKARDYAAFVKVAELKANSSNATIFADSDGAIAYLHPQFVPRRDVRFDFSKPVDGVDPATDWGALHTLNELPRVTSPANGWIMNVNDSPWRAAGKDSPRQADYPRYMDTGGENPRGDHAIRVLNERSDFTLQTLIAAAYDPWLPAFERLRPGLIRAFDGSSDPALKARLAEPVAALRAWDDRYGASSIPTSLAVFWGEDLWRSAGPAAAAAAMTPWDYMATRSTDAERLAALDTAVDRLTRDFGSWRTPWGEINRFQRLTGDIVHPFDDSKPSVAVPFASAQWGSLASFGARARPGTKRYYGTSGNSFVATVEFGPRVTAMAVTAGGASGDPASPHFNDQAGRYASGGLRPVHFYPEDVARHARRTYAPGK